MLFGLSILFLGAILAALFEYFLLEFGRDLRRHRSGRGTAVAIRKICHPPQEAPTERLSSLRLVHSGPPLPSLPPEQQATLCLVETIEGRRIQRA